MMTKPCKSSWALALAALTAAAIHAQAATFTVTNTADSGAGSLRQAIADANAAAGTDEIVFDASFNTPQTITLTTGDLVFPNSVNSNVTVTGPGASLLTVSGNNNSKIFSIAETPVVNISGMTLTDGNGVGVSPGDTFGGAVYNQGVLTLTRMVITGNSAAGDGGGVYNSTGDSLTVLDCDITNNVANSDSTGSNTGGGIHCNGGSGSALTVTNSLIHGNSILGTSGGGGGLRKDAGGTFAVTNSTVSDNSCAGSGGGISSGATATVTGSTITGNSSTAGSGGGINTGSAALTLNQTTVSGNSAGSIGGGIFRSGSPLLTLTSSTIVNNTAVGAGGGVNSSSSSGGPTNVGNTIIANNTDNGTAPDYRGPITSQGYNLIESVTTQPTFTGDTATNIIGVDPNLGPLQDNGGPTLTHALLVGSPALDKGKSSGSTTDQRGFLRPVDAPGIANAAGGDGADIGAVEAQPPVAVADAPSTNEDTAVTVAVLANDFDVDNDSLTIAEVTQGANGAVVINNTNPNTVTYTPNANFFGTDTFTYRVSDGTFQSAAATVTVTVNPINDAPSFTKGANQTVNEDAAAQSVTGWATSISQGPNETGQTLTFNVSITGTTGGLTFSSAPAVSPTGTLSYTPAANSNGTATLSVTLSDNGSSTPPHVNTSAAQTFTITVNAVNDGPTLAAISNPAAIPEDSGEQTINFSGITAGPANESTQTLSVTASSNNTALIPNPTVTYTSPNGTGSLKYTPVANQSGSATITVTVQDNGGGTNSLARTFTVNVTPVNDAPVITGQLPVSTEFNTSRTIMFSDLQVTDIDNSYPTGFTLTAMNGVNYTRSGNTITPAVNFYGTLTVPVKVNDGALDSNTFQLSLTVNPDPQEVKSKTRIEPEPGGGYRITFIGNPGQQYTVQFATALTATTNWQFLGQRVADPQGSYFIIDNPPAGTPARFYRAVVP